MNEKIKIILGNMKHDVSSLNVCVCFELIIMFVSHNGCSSAQEVVMKLNYTC